MNKSNTFSLKATITQRAIDAKLASGKFTDSGAKYSPEQAVSDSNNPALRMTATIDGSKLSWSK
jgi:hypothetical protein